MEEKLRELYIHIFEPELIEEIIEVGHYRKIRAEVPMIDIGDSLTHMPLILEGAIRVMSEDKEGNEYLLYYLEVGDSCTMTMTCCMGGKRSKIRAITEKETQLIMVPIPKMEAWLVKYRSWRAFVFDSYDNRMSEMLTAIDTVVFHNMEARLYRYLRDKAMVLRTGELKVTHSQIANDLYTSRVVISRLMKKLVMKGDIEMHRNLVRVLEFL